MGDRECVLRVIAFMRTPYREYKAGNLDAFLNDCMRGLNQVPDSEIRELDLRFRRTMLDCFRIFGDRAFRKQRRGSSKRFPINRALFEVWSASVEPLSPSEVDRLVERRSDLIGSFLGALDDPGFASAISYGTGDPQKVRLRFSTVEQIIQEVLQ